jgi:hypothetical protein
MDKNDFYDHLRTRTASDNAHRIATAMEESGLLDRLHFLKDGLSTSVFTIEGSNLVLKIFDQRRQKNAPLRPSRFTLQNREQLTLQDDSPVSISLAPKLTDKGVTLLHQEMLRYKLWTEEGSDFWDILPSHSQPHEIKNVLLDASGVPYQIDSDAVRRFDDRYNKYPANGDGKRSDADYLRYRKDSFNRHGRSDAISAERFAAIAAACDACEWPLNQGKLLSDAADQNVLASFKTALRSLRTPQSLAAR